MGNIIDLIIVCGALCGMTAVIGGIVSVVEYYIQIREARSESHRKFVERHHEYLKNR